MQALARRYAGHFFHDKANYRIKFYANLKAPLRPSDTLVFKEQNLMNHPDKRAALPQQSSTDSFFGMALAQAFMGMVYGPCADQIWDAGETLSAIYEDRYDQKRTNGRGVYELGKKSSLAECFTRMTEKTVAELERLSFRPSYAPAHTLSL